ncbi:STAS domain-containing protein [Kitasatospora sp. NPDC092039]|uniref:STAS domain-containing protein n=1 Tax=Kitasatospora sp. NPDC092039 TaxID=3364086 RepID=UPI0038003BF5
MDTVETTPGGPALTCDLGALTAPDLAVVDALARLRLAAARQGVAVVLLNAGGPLRELLAFSGLSALLPGAADPLDLAELLFGPGPGRQPGREAEEREEHVGVQEVGEAGEPAP